MSIIARPGVSCLSASESVTVAGHGVLYYALPWSQGGISSFQASGQRMRERDEPGTEK